MNFQFPGGTRAANPASLTGIETSGRFWIVLWRKLRDLDAWTLQRSCFEGSNITVKMEEVMGLLDGLIGGAVGAEMVTVVNGLIEKHGGVKGIVDQFQREGLGPTIQSWVGTGENQPISPEQVNKALGSDTIQQLAAKLGIPPDQMAARLSEILPQAVDKLTPNGTVQ
jgi:uncharacterized protein YidB (DUF937 family)